MNGGKLGGEAQSTVDTSKKEIEASQKAAEEAIKKAQAEVKAELDAVKKVKAETDAKFSAARVTAEGNDTKCEEILKRAQTTYGGFADKTIGPAIKAADDARLEREAIRDEINKQGEKSMNLIADLADAIDDPDKAGALTKQARDSLAKLLAMFNQTPAKFDPIIAKSKAALEQAQAGEKTLKSEWDAKAKSTRNTVTEMNASVKANAIAAKGDPEKLKDAIKSAQETSRNIEGHVAELDGFGGAEPKKLRVEVATKKADVDLIIGDMEKDLKASEKS